ncbi:MAG: DUF3365 domain-containing protein [Bacteroidia bacterium]
MKRIVIISMLSLFWIIGSCSKPENKQKSFDELAEELHVSAEKSIRETQEFARSMELELFYEKAPTIAAAAQAELLKNVGVAMKNGGPTNAVGFCNIHASSIIDSLSNELNARISRVSDRNRNPQQTATDDEKALMAFFTQHKKTKDTLINETYYKPIVLGMPTCLKCHGKPLVDINEPTLKVIDERYPHDLAKGYVLGETRGLWKIEFLSSREK